MLNSFMTMATFSSWNSIKKAHHVDFVDFVASKKMRCPTKYLRGRISNYNNNNGGTAETDESSDSYISD
jgi:hypothetical protein